MFLVITVVYFLALKPTFSDDTSCTPTTANPFLFAYSNDLDPDVVLGAWDNFDDGFSFFEYSTFANVRFDVRQEEKIEYHTDLLNATYSIKTHLPNPSLGFTSSSAGSDVLRVIERFFNNIQSSRCGSTLLIFLKRYPNETDINNIVAKVRQHHAIVHVISSDSPSGGLQSKTMYNIASKTNGLGPFLEDNQIGDLIDYLPLYLTPYPIYATNVQVLEQGTVTLPPMSVPISGSYYFTVTVQDHGPIDSFQQIDLGWYSSDSSLSNDFIINRSLFGTYAQSWYDLDPVVYNMTLAYNFNDRNVETLQIRVFSGTSLDHWLPYAN